MPDLSQSSLSTQFVQVQVNPTTVEGAPYDPTGDAVAMAFILDSLPSAEPGPSDWVSAQWKTGPGGTYWATLLVGPANGGLVLGAGTYTVWVKIIDFPAVPAIAGPQLEIT